MSLLICEILEKDGRVAFEGSGLLRYNLHIVKFTLKYIQFFEFCQLFFFVGITTTTVKIQNSLSPPKGSWLCVVTASDLIHVPIFLLFPECHKLNRIICSLMNLSSSLSIMILRLIYCPYIGDLFHFIAEQCVYCCVNALHFVFLFTS